MEKPIWRSVEVRFMLITSAKAAAGVALMLIGACATRSHSHDQWAPNGQVAVAEGYLFVNNADSVSLSFTRPEYDDLPDMMECVNLVVPGYILDDLTHLDRYRVSGIELEDLDVGGMPAQRSINGISFSLYCGQPFGAPNRTIYVTGAERLD